MFYTLPIIHVYLVCRVASSIFQASLLLVPATALNALLQYRIALFVLAIFRSISGWARAAASPPAPTLPSAIQIFVLTAPRHVLLVLIIRKTALVVSLDICIHQTITIHAKMYAPIGRILVQPQLCAYPVLFHALTVLIAAPNALPAQLRISITKAAQQSAPAHPHPTTYQWRVIYAQVHVLHARTKLKIAHRVSPPTCITRSPIAAILHVRKMCRLLVRAITRIYVFHVPRPVRHAASP